MTDRKDYWSSVSEEGSIRISEEVVASISSIAALEVSGVKSLSSGITDDIAGFLGKKNISRGVKVVFDAHDVDVDISIVVKSDSNICDIAKKVQESAKSAIFSMTGLNARSINVCISGISFDKVLADNGLRADKSDVTENGI